MKICITPRSIQLMATYFERSLKDVLSDNVTYDELIDNLYAKALSEFKGDEFTASSAESILQHMTIVPQVVSRYIQEPSVKVSNEFASAVNAAKSDIYSASQSKNAEDFGSEILKIAGIVGVAPMEILRLAESERFDAVSWYFARSIVQAAIYDPKTGYKENINDPRKVFEDAIQTEILNSNNMKGYRFKVVPYSTVKSDESAVDTTDYRGDDHYVMVLIDSAGNTVKFNDDIQEDVNGKFPIFKLKTNRIEFNYQVKALALLLSKTEELSLDEATANIEKRVGAHLENINSAIARVKEGKDVAFELDMNTSSIGFVEVNELYHTPLEKISNRDEIKFTIEPTGTRQNVPAMFIPHSSRMGIISNNTLDQLDPTEKEFLIELFTNNDLMLDGKPLVNDMREKLISNFVRLNWSSEDRPVIAISFKFNKRTKVKSNQVAYITLGGKRIDIGKPTSVEDFTNAFNSFVGSYKGYVTKHKPVGRDIAESLEDVKFQGQYYKDENGNIKVASKPEISFSLFAGVKDINAKRTVISSITDNEIELDDQSVSFKDHIVKNGYTILLPTKTDKGLILRGHGAYIGFNPIASEPEIDISDTDALWRSVSENNAQEEVPTAEEETAADEWYADPIRNPLGQVLKLTISEDVSEKGPAFVANFLKDSINLFKGSSKTDLYHETFHAYFNGLLKATEREAIYKELRSQKGNFTTVVNGVSSTVAFKDGTDIELEEYLAEEFRAYARDRSKYNKKPKSKIAQFFADLLARLKTLFGNRTVNEVVVLNKMRPIVQAAFKDLYEGNIDVSKFEAPTDQKEKWHSLEASPKLKLSYQDVSVVMGSVQALISDYINVTLNSTSTAQSNKALIDRMARLSTLDITNPKYKEESDAIKKEIHSIVNNNEHGGSNGYGIFRINEQPRVLEYALTYVKNVFAQRLELYKSDNSKISKDNVKLLTKVIDNFGNVSASRDTFKSDDSTIIGLFLNNYNIISTEKLDSIESVDEMDDLEEGLEERLIYGKTGAEFSPHETADSYTEQLLSSIIKYTGQGEGSIQENRIGIGRLLPFRTAMGKVIGATKGLVTPEQMYDAIFSIGEVDAEMSQIALKLGDPRKDLSNHEQNQWTAFWQSTVRANQEVRIFTLEKMDTEEGVESHFIAKSGKFKQGSSIIGREWKANFADNIDRELPYNEGGLLNPEKLTDIFGLKSPESLANESLSSLRELASFWEIPNYLVMSKEDLISRLSGKKHIPIEGSNDLYHDVKKVGVKYRRPEPFHVSNPFPMLRALGITLPETREVRDAIVYGSNERGVDSGIVDLIYTSLKNRADAVEQKDTLLETFDEIFKGYNYNFWNSALDVEDVDYQPDLNGYLKMLQAIGEELSDDHVTHIGRNADNEQVSERPFHSALTLQIATLNSAKHYDEVLNTPGMEHFDYTYNPQIAANPWLVQMFRLDNTNPSIKGTRDSQISFTVDTLGGSKVKHGELEKGIGSLSSDKKTKYNTDFTQTLLGRQELFRMEAKATSLTVFAPQMVRGDGAIRRGLVINAEEIESIFSEGYLDIKGFRGSRLFDNFVGHLEAELIRISRLNQLEADVKAGKQIEFDQAYIDRGKQFYMFDLIFRGSSKSLRQKMLKKNITESFTLKDSLDRDEKKEIETALRNYFILRAKEEYDNYRDDLVIPQNIFEEFALPEDEKEDTVKRMVNTFVVNNFLQNANFASAFLGDVALYNVAGEDFHKRIAGLISTGTLFRFDESWYKYVNAPKYKIRGFAEKHAQENAISLEAYDYKGYLNTGVMKEATFKSLYKKHYDTFFKGESPNETKEYEEIKEADGQAWITMDAYRMLADSNNDWTSEQESIYQRLLNGEAINQLTIRATFPVKKYQHYGPVTNANALENVRLQMMAFHKYSLMPLIPGVGMIEGTPLEDLNKRMMESGLDYVTMESGSKLSTIKKLNADPTKTEADDIYNSNREVTNNAFTVNKIHVRHLKNQVSVGSWYKGNITLWTQMRSMISLGLLSDGIPTDYKGKKDWHKLTPAEKLEQSDNWKISEEMNEVMDTLESHLMDELIDDLGITPTEKVVGEGKNARTITTYSGNTKRLASYLQTQMKGQDMLPEEMAYIIDENGELIKDLSLSVNAEKIESLLITMVDKKLRRLKVTGEGLTQAAGTMLEKKGSKPTEEDLEKWAPPVNGTNGLRTYYLEDGTIQLMEVKIALQGDFKKLFRLKHPDKERIAVYSEEGLDFNTSLARLNEAIKDTEWLESHGNMITITGPRIPSQQENSLEAARIAEFLPPVAGPIIIVPTEVVAKAGSDFDHDKLFMMFNNIVSYGRGKDITVEVQKYNRNEKLSYSALANELSLKKDVVEKLREKREDLEKKRDALWDEIKDVRDEIKGMLSDEDKTLKATLRDRWISANGHINALLKKIDFSVEGTSYRYADITHEKRMELIENFMDIMDEIDEQQVELYDTYYDRVQELVKASKEISPSTKANLTKNANSLEALKVSLEEAYKEEDIATRRLDTKSTKGLENELLSLFAKRITMGNNMADLIQNNSVDQVKPVSQQLEKLVRGKYNKYNRGEDAPGKDISGTTLYDYRFNLQKHQENSVAMDSLGIAAVVSTFHAMFSQMGAKLKGVTKAEQAKFESALAVLSQVGVVSEDQYNEAREFVDKYSSYTLKFDHNFVENALGKQIALGVRTNQEGKTISSVIGQLINGYVDVARDAFIFNVQGNKENTPMLLFLVMAGVKPKTAIYFTSSSLIREYTSIKSEMNGVFSNMDTTYGTTPIVDKGKIVKNARAKMFSKYQDLITKNTGSVLSSEDYKIVSNTVNKNYDDKTLLSFVMDKKNPTWNEFVLFSHYLEVEDMSEDITRFTANTKFSTQKINSISDAEGRRIRTGYALNKSNAVPNSWYKDMDEKTLNGIMNNDKFFVEIFSEYFKLRNHPMVVAGSIAAKPPVGVEKTVFQNDFKNDFIAFLAQNSLYGSDLYDGVSLVESEDVDAPLDYDEETSTYTYGAATLKEYKDAATNGLLNAGNANADLLNKFPTDNHFIRYDIELKRLQVETENMSDAQVRDKFYYAFDTKAQIVTRAGILTKIALYRSDNNIAMFDYRMGMSSIFDQIKKKHPHLEGQFDLVHDLKRDHDVSLGKTNLFLHNVSDPDMLKIYKENYRDLMNSRIPEVSEFFGRFAIMALMQTGMNRRAKYDLVRVVNNDIFEVLIKNGVHLENVFNRLDEGYNQVLNKQKEVTTKYLDEFTEMFTKMAEKSYKIRNKGYNYITEDFEGKKTRKALPIENIKTSYANAMMTGKVVRIAMGTQYLQDVSTGKKTTTIRSDSQINMIGLQKGESSIINILGQKYVVTYRGVLSVDEAGGKAAMIKSEALPTVQSEENFYEIESDGVKYYAKYKQTVNFLSGQGGLGVYDIRKAPEDKFSNKDTKTTTQPVTAIDNSSKPVFNSLPNKSSVPTMTYAGIGSRETPQEVLELMPEAAKYLESLGYTLRSGEAVGADKAFEKGVTSKKEIFPGNVKTGERELKIAEEIHPAWKVMLDSTRKKAIAKGNDPERSAAYVANLMARNTNQIFGKNLDTPVDFVLFYAKETSDPLRPAGGTGQAVEMARRKGIPTINMADTNWRGQLKTALANKPTTQPTDSSFTINQKDVDDIDNPCNQ